MNEIKSLTVTYGDGTTETFVKEVVSEPAPEPTPIQKIIVPLNTPIELITE